MGWCRAILLSNRSHTIPLLPLQTWIAEVEDADEVDPELVHLEVLHLEGQGRRERERRQ